MNTDTPLLTDLYQLTMAYAYWRLGMHERPASFHLLFRKNPFDGNYALCCGLGSVVEFLQHWRFREEDIDYLKSLKSKTKEKLFPQKFLNVLRDLKFTCDLDAIPEGTVVFPHIPLLRIQGPLLQCQLLETPLLNLMNFQTLIATKASRVCRAAEGDDVVEFGMRRAQGPNGAVSASRAAYIGGCIATSNTLAGKLYDIPVLGTHAHSFVSAFTSELDAFNAYASVLPDNCVLLVDTYHTLTGVKHAIETCKKLKASGVEFQGIRLDSGDMADLSKKTRKLLDKAGFTSTKIMASNTLDEYVIADLKKRGAKIDAWGVGTHLATAYDQPALDGVYKLSALQNEKGQWEYKLKLSDDPIKISDPGRHQVRRFFCNDRYVLDVIYDLTLNISDNPEAVLLDRTSHLKKLDDFDAFVDLLEPVFKKGKLIQTAKSIHDLRATAIAECHHFFNTHGEKNYAIALEKNLFELKKKLIKELTK